MDIKPIHNETDYQAALKEIDTLLESKVGTSEGDRLDVLVTLVEAFESINYLIPEQDDPVRELEYYMESRGLSRTVMIPYLGSKDRVSEILNCKCGLSLEMIRRLHSGLGTPVELLMGNHAHRSPLHQRKQSVTHIGG
jgi:HTH-type transcriptional regulator / antitoxin HigA